MSGCDLTAFTLKYNYNVFNLIENIYMLGLPSPTAAAGRADNPLYGFFFLFRK